MKFNSDKTSSRRKNRKAHFSATSVERRVRMSAGLSKDLFQKFNVRSLPVRKDDEVRVCVGKLKGQEGKVVACYRKKYVIHVERCTRDKVNGQTIFRGIDPSNVVITKIKMDKSRKAILDRKNRANVGKKTAAVDVDNMAGVD
eukprot:CAMPEP_0174818006 /NCGR_PEP_ID=MMETSP1107-20130205/597_1 /TAXON_ID=36770 /ORGANISM="Paraphysomonas vestita, Strain GFlagA" /LENGTH=142 /DNA_ID=CAMNT_0016029285 /DNA_START=63 /DNA_END=491 /DNA_ORIENTATION=-